MYQRMEDEPGRRSQIWRARLSSALRSGAWMHGSSRHNSELGYLEEAGTRHWALYRLLQWIGILDCSLTYEVLVILVLRV